MFNIFNRGKSAKREYPDLNPEDQEHALILTLNLGDLPEMSTEEVFKAIQALEGKLEGLLPKGSELDGDEFGEGVCNIYIYGKNADDMYKAVEEALRKSKFEHIDVYLRYGGVDDDGAKEKRFTL